MFEIFTISISAVFAATVFFAMASDYWRMTIPNAVGLTLAAAYVVFVLVTPGQNVLFAVGVALAAFLITTVLFAMRGFGGGDVKFLAAVALWTTPGTLAPFLLIMSLAGVALSVGIVVARRFHGPQLAMAGSPRPLRGPRLWASRSACPYGIPIGLGALIILLPRILGV